MMDLVVIVLVGGKIYRCNMQCPECGEELVLEDYLFATSILQIAKDMKWWLDLQLVMKKC